MKIKRINAKSIKDSRKEKTIFIEIETTSGKFSASAPTGKSTGKHEVKSYKKSLEQDIEFLKNSGEYFSEENIDCFEDLRRIEDIADGHIGGNSLFALESAVLKAVAKEQNKEVWEIINTNARLFPRLVGNCIGGGKHSDIKTRKPDFQEFEIIPKEDSVKESWKVNLKIKKELKIELKKRDKEFSEKTNDENAWMTSLTEKEIFEILNNFPVDSGSDIAASSFYKRKKYSYFNPPLTRTAEEQLEYLSNLIKNLEIFYIEDPFGEEDFESFALLLKRFPQKLIVGDDLTVTNVKRLKKAIEKKSINGIIVKPNQCGSLLEVKEVCEFARENNIKTIFSHRSGETEETILADLAFGFQADFFKCGIDGPGRESKIKRLIEIEKKISKK